MVISYILPWLQKYFYNQGKQYKIIQKTDPKFFQKYLLCDGPMSGNHFCDFQNSNIKKLFQFHFQATPNMTAIDNFGVLKNDSDFLSEDSVKRRHGFGKGRSINDFKQLGEGGSRFCATV